MLKLNAVEIGVLVVVGEKENRPSIVARKLKRVPVAPSNLGNDTGTTCRPVAHHDLPCILKGKRGEPKKTVGFDDVTGTFPVKWCGKLAERAARSSVRHNHILSLCQGVDKVTKCSG